jgi:hypothetical protein
MYDNLRNLKSKWRGEGRPAYRYLYTLLCLDLDKQTAKITALQENIKKGRGGVKQVPHKIRRLLLEHPEFFDRIL